MSKCTDTGHKTLENSDKPLVLKELMKLWQKEDPDIPWEEGDYSPSNTLWMTLLTKLFAVLYLSKHLPMSIFIK